VKYLEAAEVILRESDGPMTTGEITERAIVQGLIRPRGKTPQATMSAALYCKPADAPIARVFEPGPKRARRGSVRWKHS
jgi:hypothetical protein